MKDQIENIQNLTKLEMINFISNYTDEDFVNVKKIANRMNTYKNRVFIRGLIEFTNYCKNNCKYCGIRSFNKNICRYRMEKSEIFDLVKTGVEYGFKSFVLQGGEDSYYKVNDICNIVSNIKSKYNDIAITLSIGEKSYEEYKKYKEAGVDRYLLRHETITKSHYNLIHNIEMSYENRINCLKNLKKLGYQVGAGFMVGSPYQTIEMIVEDLFFLKKFKPEMVGIGPFLPQKDTEFHDRAKGDIKLTLLLISIIRILLPNALIPSTTALSYETKNGFIDGVESGANVIMLNLTPKKYRDKYLIYDNKNIIKDEFNEDFDNIKNELKKINKFPEFSRGDYEEN